MRELKGMNVIQIEITNQCNRECANCTRFCGHYTKDKIFQIDIDRFEKCCYSLKDFPRIIGMIGGEPTLHPDFEDMCKIIRKYHPRHLSGLWTNTTTAQYRKHFDLIQNTFGIQNLNNHTAPIIHTPVLAASEDIIEDEAIRKKFIDNCWIQMLWSATMTPKGGYFCEVAGMLSWLFNGPDGKDIEKNPDWQKEPLTTFSDQIEWACNKCGAALPLKPRRSNEKIDDISQSNLDRLKLVKSPKILNGLYEISDGMLIEGQNRACDWYWNR